MILHTNPQLFRQAIQVTSQRTGLKEIYIEKDYWVTLALKIIFSSQLKEMIVFKGGTALSKAFKSIERFSEDIDLVLLRRETDTANQLKKKLKLISSLVAETLPEIELSGITRKMGMNRKIRHIYDISRLMTDPKISDFIQSNDFEEMLLRVARDDFKSFSQNTWLANHPKESLMFDNPESIWLALQKTYFEKFRYLVYGKLPDEKEIISSLNLLSNRIAKIDWSPIVKLFENRPA